MLRIDQAVVGVVGLIEGTKSLGLLRPSEAATVDNSAAQSGAMTAEKFCQ